MTRGARMKLLGSTRGRVLSLLRWGPRTAGDLAEILELTANAVRLHLAALERDGLVEQHGSRASGGKPALLYTLTSEAEALFPKGYAAVLSEVLAYVREREGDAGLERFLRAIGARLAARYRARPATLRQRVDDAVGLLGSLGGLARVEEEDDAFVIRGASCPLAAIVGAHPETCALAEELVAGVVAAEVRESCERGARPHCVLRVLRSDAA